MSLHNLLLAITNDPDRGAVQGALADWLEEHGDSRASAVRAVSRDPNLWCSFAPHATGVEPTIENIRAAIHEGSVACDREMRQRIVWLFPEEAKE